MTAPSSNPVQPIPRREEYNAYLRSDAWRVKRAQVLVRSGNACEHCGELAVIVHHLRYPRALGTEPLTDLIAVCQRCHDLHHGVRPMTKTEVIREASVVQHPSPSGRPFQCIETAGRLFATVEAWGRALGWDDLGYLESSLIGITCSNPEWLADYQGRRVYRWHAVDDALLAFAKAHEDHGHRSREPIIRAAYERLYENYKALRNWGRDLQERAILDAYQKGKRITPTLTPIEHIAMAMQQLVPQVQQHEAKIIEHDEKIAEIAKALPAPRDPNEFITVKQAIAERGLDASILPVPESRWNLAQIAGHRLAEAGAERGEPIPSRLDGVAVVKPVQTYRRSAIFAVLEELMRPKSRRGAGAGKHSHAAG
jgi:hypothetical protein